MSGSSADLELVPHSVVTERCPDNSLTLHSSVPMDAVVNSVGDWLHRWAEEKPNAVFLGERSGDGWREISFSEALERVRSLAAGLLGRGLDESTPIVLLSGNSIDHALLSFAAQYVGVPAVPVAEQYSLIPGAHERLAFVLDKVHPRIAFADDASKFAEALRLPQLANSEIIISRGTVKDRTSISVEALTRDDRSDVDVAHAAVGPDTLAKILFTSGSSSEPKGVLTTQRMMCTNQAQMASVLPFLKTRPQQVVDWLPWNHVFGGSHNLNMMLANGGSYYIDRGKPTKGDFVTTVENLKQRSQTIAFNVPVGFEMLSDAMERDNDLRAAFFRDLDLIFYAGAALPESTWKRLERLAVAERGRLPLMISSWGMTETAPAAIMQHQGTAASGVVGVPLPGVVAKLLPTEEARWELRVKGPNVTEGYYRDPDRTREAFDEDGYLITGDAVRFVDQNHHERGVVFDGRMTEDFKLATGTWVKAGRLRLDALAHLAGIARDVVICGENRSEIGMLIFPVPEVVPGNAIADGAIADPDLGARVASKLAKMAASATGSANRIARAIVLAAPPSLTRHEMTDKGSLNSRKILAHRSAIVERLYDDDDPAVIRIG